MAQSSLLVDSPEVPRRGLILAGVVLAAILAMYLLNGGSRLVAAHWPLLTRAVKLVAHPAIRNRGWCISSEPWRWRRNGPIATTASGLR